MNDIDKPEIAPFPRPSYGGRTSPVNKSDTTVSSITQNIREQAQLILKMCDEADAAIAASEKHAREAADSLMEMIKRVK